MGFGLSAVRLLVGQSLADHSLDRFNRPLGIGDFKRRTLIVPEIELGKVPLQMLLRNMMVRAGDAALKDGEVRLDDVGVSIAANVFLDAVIDRLMARKVAVHMPVLASSSVTSVDFLSICAMRIGRSVLVLTLGTCSERTLPLRSTRAKAISLPIPPTALVRLPRCLFFSLPPI